MTPQSLSTGAAGIALLHIEHAHAGTSGWDPARAWVTAMTRDPINAHPDNCGLYHGAPAVAFTLHAAGRPAYARALETLDSHIAALVRHRLNRAHERIDCGQLPALREYDLISGLTGLGVYLLHRHGGGERLREILAYLVRLARPLHVDGQVLPGWWTGHGPKGRPSADWPGGHANLGLAHGIAGPLALLSIAARRGVAVAGQVDTIRELCEWLDQWCCGRGSAGWWPGTVSWAEWQARMVARAGPDRPSWCYGTPGLARAQQLAALALNDPTRQQHAEHALAECIADDRQLALLRDVSLCHGWAGLLLTTWRAAADAGHDSNLAARLPALRARLTHHLHRHGPPAHAGLLEGTTGIRLVEHTITSNTPSATAWDACLLLAG